MAADTEPLEILLHLPLLCEDKVLVVENKCLVLLNTNCTQSLTISEKEKNGLLGLIQKAEKQSLCRVARKHVMYG